MRLVMYQIGSTTSKEICNMPINGKIEMGIINEFHAKAKAGINDKLKTKAFVLNLITKERRNQTITNAEDEYETFPSAEDINSSIQEMFYGIKEEKTRLREMSKVSKSHKTINYQTVGGTFTKSNYVIADLGINLRMSDINQTKVPKTNDRYVGVELEFVSKASGDAMRRAFAAARLHKHVHVGTDGSVNASPGKGGSGHEVRVLMREDEVKAIMTHVSAVLNSPEIEAYVNDSCGLHVHIDCRNRNVETTYSGLVRGLPFLKSLVPNCRTKGNSYCVENSNEKFERKSNKYWAVNPNSFEEHRTIEVRLHSGSTNAKKIINWVSVLLNFANNLPKTKVVTLEDFKSFTGNSLTDLYPYLEKRIARFKVYGHIISTESDEVADFMAEMGA